MSQRRYFDFLKDMSQASLVAMHQDIFPVGIYRGCELSIDGDTVKLAKGKYICSTGMIVEETATVDVGVLSDVASGTAQILTVLGLGPSLSTVQTSAIEYSLNAGLYDKEDDLDPLNRPYIVLGYLNFDGTSWQVSSGERVALQTANPASVKLPLPFPGLGGAVTYRSGVGAVHRATPTTAGANFWVPLNNAAPLKRVNIKCIGSSPGVSLAIVAYGDTADAVDVISGQIDAAGNWIGEVDILTTGLRNVVLRVTAAAPNASSTQLYFQEISYEQDVGYLAH